VGHPEGLTALAQQLPTASRVHALRQSHALSDEPFDSIARGWGLLPEAVEANATSLFAVTDLPGADSPAGERRP
jgi:hypothetical protein